MKDPRVITKRLAWDWWEAVIDGCPLVRSGASTEQEAITAVLERFRKEQSK